MTRRPVVYHIIASGRRLVSTASDLVMHEGRVSVELDPAIVRSRGVFVAIDPRKLRSLDEEGWIFGYAEVVDRRGCPTRRRRHQPLPARSRGRRTIDLETRQL